MFYNNFKVAAIWHVQCDKWMGLKQFLNNSDKYVRELCIRHWKSSEYHTVNRSGRHFLNSTTWAHFYSNLQRKHCVLTWNDWAGQSGDALHPGHIVVIKIVVAGCIELRSITEQLPQLGSDRHVVYDLSLKTMVKVVVLQSAIPQHANTVWRKRVRHWLNYLNWYKYYCTLKWHLRDPLWLADKSSLMLFLHRMVQHNIGGDRLLDSREVWGLKDGLDDSGIDGEDGKNDTGQKD